MKELPQDHDEAVALVRQILDSLIKAGIVTDVTWSKARYGGAPYTLAIHAPVIHVGDASRERQVEGQIREMLSDYPQREINVVFAAE